MIAETTRQNVKLIVTAYRKATRTSLSVVSKRFYGNAAFLEAFFAGKQSISIDKLDRMIEDMRIAWPAQTEWPHCRPVFMRAPGKKNGKTFPLETATAS